MSMLEILDGFLYRLTPCPRRIYNLAGSSAALYLAKQEGPFMVVEDQEETARTLHGDIYFYRKLLRGQRPPPGTARNDDDIVFLPAPDGPALAGKRAEAIHRLFLEGSAYSIITTREALARDVWRPEVLQAGVLALTEGDEVRREMVEQRLAGLGYVRVPLVTEEGQYSLRGYILDVFPATGEQPLRVEFFGDEVEGIRVFDPDTQRSVREGGGMRLLPAVEPTDGISPSVLTEGMTAYYSEGVEVDVPEGGAVFTRYAVKGEGVDAGLMPVAGLGILPGERKDMAALAHAVGEMGALNRVVVVSPSGGQAERLGEVFMDEGLICPIIEPWEIMQYGGRVSISVGGLSCGLFLPGLLILTERELFGERPHYRAMRKSRVSHLMATVEDLVEGDYVVHGDRGIGRFRGLVRQRVEGCEYDMVVIEYEGGDRLYLPLYAMEAIRKYRAEEGVVPRLDRLGSTAWKKTKQRVRKRIREMSLKLLEIYAEREVSEGLSYSVDTELHREFDSFFLYEETPDQLSAIEEIKRDMEGERPMDRLLSGDVGYGKTEVAMRAAFKAVFDGRQVAVLVPTTLLCEQHLRIFTSRFSAFPVRIDYLSRFKTKRKREETLRAVEAGEVDIVVATHTLLKTGLRFSNLGLLVIDEEHRFGVRQKEHIKGLRKGVDVLSLSATPIPRTLQMSLSGIRKMSLIETPPEERLSVKTEVSLFDEGLIAEAVGKEMQRGGQVFFLHNRIHDIEKMARKLKGLAPLARVAVAHGRMSERELEKVMLSFLLGEVDVLLCTAIIGSGLDIPNANTIIVNMAHRMGLADLYQLRGRVGRSNVRAYAYFLIPPGVGITDEAQRRLQAIQELSYMGAGFRLAMRDLEIRGAGNLLGPEQSGCIHAVGFDMYVEMLERAVAELKGVDIKKKAVPTVNIKVNAFIPEDYVEDMALRLGVYRKVAGAGSTEELEDIRAEVSDRFGRPPQPFRNLLEVMRLRVLAERLQITDITQEGARARFSFPEESGLRAEDILDALGEKVRFLSNGFEFRIEGEVFEGMNRAIELLLKQCGVD
jgi:transcription-repair coupling factor (superfamily II helicase)